MWGRPRARAEPCARWAGLAPPRPQPALRFAPWRAASKRPAAAAVTSPRAPAPLRLQQWAFGEGGLRDIWAQLPEQGQALFRLLKGASDLLMMPKDMLLDEEIREDTVALPIGAVAYMLARFQPDDYAPDGISPAVLAALRRAAAAAGQDAGAPPALEVEAECTYYSPTDDMVMEKVRGRRGRGSRAAAPAAHPPWPRRHRWPPPTPPLAPRPALQPHAHQPPSPPPPPRHPSPPPSQVEIGEEPGLEYGDESEDELNAVSDLGTDFGVPPPLRFKLLHNLWSAGVPRARRVTIQRIEG
jgi:hypothetical protein